MGFGRGSIVYKGTFQSNSYLLIGKLYLVDLSKFNVISYELVSGR
jgi:hypothetical protein